MNTIFNWIRNQFKSDQDWYLENSQDLGDLEIRLLTLQRQGLQNLYMRYWYGH